MSKVARFHINTIGRTLAKVLNAEKPTFKASKKTLAVKEELKSDREKKQNGKYSFKDTVLKIIDPEQGLNYTERCPCEIKCNYYPNGFVRSEVHILHGELHGPATFYAENGQVLAQNWYINGHMEGKGWFYYPTGKTLRT